MPVSGPYVCLACGGPFDTNPRVERWLTGKIPVSEFSACTLCWVCAHLRASVAREMGQIHKEMEQVSQ